MRFAIHHTRIAVAASVLFIACSGDSDASVSNVPVQTAGSASLPPTLTPTAAAAGSGAQAALPTATSTGMPMTAANPAMSPSAAMPTAGAAAAPMSHGEDHPAQPMTGGMTPMQMAAHESCKLVATPDPRDAMLTNEPKLVMGVGQQDTLMPQIVLDWMDENQFAQAHDGWHLVRKWDQTCRKSNATTCTAAKRLEDQGLKRAAIQQGAPGDGVAFMMMHRHMIMMLNVAFPTHKPLFTGFNKVPRTTSDPENPQPWRQISWTSSNTTGFDILENIEKHLDQFPTEDDLGQFIENTYKWTAQSPTSPVNAPGSGLHGALHAQWSVNGSPANLIQQSVDVKNYAFWKLHGWIDNVWERYRKAKGLTEADPAYQKLMMEQCMEMFTLQPRNRGGMSTGGTTSPGTDPTTAPETGVFAQMVRPIFDNNCAGCHSAIAPTAGMTLGGSGVSSAEVLDGLISQKATNGEFNLIEPGQPQKSWVYLKASGDVATATCTGMCDREKMPPSGMGLSQAQLTTIRDWIMSGAPRQ